MKYLSRATLLVVLTSVIVGCASAADLRYARTDEHAQALRLAARILEIDRGGSLVRDVEARMQTLFSVGRKADAGIAELIQKASIDSDDAGLRISWYKERIHVAFIVGREDTEYHAGFDILTKDGLVVDCGGPNFRVQ